MGYATGPILITNISTSYRTDCDHHMVWPFSRLARKGSIRLFWSKMITMLACLITLVVGYLVGWAVGKSRPTYKHVHIWEPWKTDQINIVNSAGKFLYKRDIQTRSCMDCGWTESEYINRL